MQNPLLVLAFDHRKSIRGLFGIEGPPTPGQAERISAAKLIILDGLLAAHGRMDRSGTPGLLVDEEFGSEVIARATGQGVVTAVACERSGQAEFQFEYGDDFASHLERVRPDFAKALVRFNVGGDRELNLRQIERLKVLAGWLADHRPKLLFELLVPPTEAQLKELGNDRDRFDAELRPELVCDAITELQDAGIEPAVWKIEGLEDRADCERVAAACRRDGRDDARCLILGRGADFAKVEHWLEVAAPVEGFDGFAIGRSIWWNEIDDFLGGRADRGETVDRIAANYLHFVDVYLDA